MNINHGRSPVAPFRANTRHYHRPSHRRTTSWEDWVDSSKNAPKRKRSSSRRFAVIAGISILFLALALRLAFVLWGYLNHS